MKTISDIRLYKSEGLNEYGNPVICPFADKRLNIMVSRIVMKLRECNFSLGEFDHLYVNFTTCDVPGRICMSDKVDQYHPWYRYCFVQISNELFDNFGEPDTYDDIIDMIRTVLVDCFATDDFDEARISACIRLAVEQGGNMLIRFREKKASKRRAVVYLRLPDTGGYYPLLRVYDAEDNLLFERDLPETLTLDCLGDIQLSAKKVTIKPRKNAIAAEMKLEPMTFEY